MREATSRLWLRGHALQPREEGHSTSPLRELQGGVGLLLHVTAQTVNIYTECSRSLHIPRARFKQGRSGGL